MSDHEMVLLRQFTRTGDAEAFSEITRRYAGLVYSTCLRVTGDTECARDATQDTFFQLLKHAGRVSGSLGGWLHQVATRRAVDLVRRDRARRDRERAFAADAVQETDAWAEVSPLVDEAMTELEPAQCDLLLRHFLRGESTVQMAATEGVSQPTMSRRVEAALEQLRERLRKKGVGVGAAVLTAMMAGATQEAPAMVLAELGKMALVTAGTTAASAATATVLGLNTKLAVAAAVAVVGVGGYMAYQAVRPVETAPPAAITTMTATAPATAGEPVAPATEPTATAVGAQTGSETAHSSASPALATVVSTDPSRTGGTALTRTAGGSAVRGGGGSYGVAVVAGGLGFGGTGTGGMMAATPPTRATTEGALTLFANALYAMALGRSDLARLDECFTSTAEAKAFRRLWENPANDDERELQQALKSLGPTIEVVQTTATDDGVKVKWEAAVRQPFTMTENGVARTWQRGERFALETRLEQADGEWKILGF